jgi:erythromycin esterase
MISQNNNIVKAINENAFEIKETNPEIEIEKNDKLDSFFKNVRIFGFGEATHGTKEFFDLKIKFFKYLVKNHGVKNFAIEASYGNCIAIDNYIKGENADPKELLNDIGLWIWNNEEVLSLIKWMKSYNSTKNKSDQLNFYGIDIMDCSNSAKLMYDHITNNSFQNKSDYLNILNNYTSRKNSDNLKKKDLNEHLKAMSELKEVLKNSSSENKDFYIGLQNSIIQYINFCLDYNQETRDREMSENINEIFVTSENDSKVFVWSHNFHIKKNLITYTNDLAMGHFLKEKYGNEYYSVGFDFATGTFNAYDIDNKKIDKFSITEPMKNTSSELFNESSFEFFFLDFNSISKIDVLKDFINSKVKYRGIGSTYNPKMIEKEKLKDAYDGIIFVNKTKATTLLRK